MSHPSTTTNDASGLGAARKTTGIAIVLLVIFTAIIVSTTDVSSPLLQVLAFSPIVPALAYFAYAAKQRS